MSQRIDLRNLPLTICGPGRIPDNAEINPAECLYSDDKTKGIPIRILPSSNSFSMKIGGTVFDVSTHFNTDGRQSILQQFRDLILSENLS